jgi:microcystin degradation protein MlrC
MRIGIISLMHESNTFVTGMTPLSAFERDRLITGNAIRDQYAGTHHEVGGFFESLDAESIEAVPVFAAWTMPSGTIERSAAEELTHRLIQAVKEAGPLDGWLVAPHGAAVADGFPDFDGHWLEQFRKQIGPDVPVVGTLDLHANLSPKMATAANAWFAYRTNPHLDQRQTGIDAARLIARTVRGDVRPTTASALPPVVVNIEAQATAESPCRELEAFADEIRRRPNVLSVSVLLGFPYADVVEMGAALTVTTNNDSALARQYATELVSWWWDRRAQFRGNLVSIDDAIRKAQSAPGPVCLLDMGDNVGGGSPADSTILIHELIRQRMGPSFVCLYDPIAATLLAQLAPGDSAHVAIGGHTDDRHGKPLNGYFTVRGIFDGLFEETVPRHGGIKRFDQGLTVVAENSSGTTVMINSRRTGPFSLRQLTSCGIDPSKFQVIVAKGVHAPVAAYSPVCPTLIRVNTPGSTSSDLSHFEFHHRRRPLYPFEPEMEWTPTAQ